MPKKAAAPAFKTDKALLGSVLLIAIVLSIIYFNLYLLAFTRFQYLYVDQEPQKHDSDFEL